jgi:hypothetical protein
VPRWLTTRAAWQSRKDHSRGRSVTSVEPPALRCARSSEGTPSGFGAPPVEQGDFDENPFSTSSSLTGRMTSSASLPLSGMTGLSPRFASSKTRRRMGGLRRVHRSLLHILSTVRSQPGLGPDAKKRTVSSAHAQISIAIVSPSRKWVCRSSGSADAVCSWVKVGEDGSLRRPMLIWPVGGTGGANVVSTSHRESPRFFPGSGT